MKKLGLLLVGAAAFALTSGAQAADMAPFYKAQPPEVPAVSGYLGLYWGADLWNDGLTVDNGITPRTRGTAFVYGGEGRLNYWLSPGMSFQVDAEAEATTRFSGARGATNDDDGRLSGVFGGHLSWRNPQYLYGVFGALSYANNMGEEGSMHHGIVGVEAQAYFGDFTLYGQAGGAFVFGSPATEDVPMNLWFLRGVGRWFATPNDKVQGQVGYARLGDALGEGSPSRAGDIWNWGVSYEHRFNVPISVFAEYSGSQFNGGHGCFNRPTNNVVKGGVKIYFNQNTLLKNDRDGATLDMPKFPKALPWADTANDCFGVISDIRVKRDIVQIARLDNGISLYRYRYLWSNQVYVGVMAQEVALRIPEAVLLAPDGYLRVDYARLGMRLQTWDQWLLSDSKRDSHVN